MYIINQSDTVMLVHAVHMRDNDFNICITLADSVFNYLKIPQLLIYCLFLSFELDIFI